MIYLFANVLSSRQLRPESSFYSVPSCTASYLQPNSERRKEGQRKGREHRKACPLGKNVLGEPFSWEKGATAEERTDPWDQKSPMV